MATATARNTTQPSPTPTVPTVGHEEFLPKREQIEIVQSAMTEPRTIGSVTHSRTAPAASAMASSRRRGRRIQADEIHEETIKDIFQTTSAIAVLYRDHLGKVARANRELLNSGSAALRAMRGSHRSVYRLLGQKRISVEQLIGDLDEHLRHARALDEMLRVLGEHAGDTARGTSGRWRERRPYLSLAGTLLGRFEAQYGEECVLPWKDIQHILKEYNERLDSRHRLEEVSINLANAVSDARGEPWFERWVQHGRDMYERRSTRAAKSTSLKIVGRALKQK